MATITITGVSTEQLANWAVAYFCIKSDGGNAVAIQANEVSLGIFDVDTEGLEVGDKIVFLLISQYGGILKVESRFVYVLSESDISNNLEGIGYWTIETDFVVS